MITSQPSRDSDGFMPDLTPLLDIIFIVMVFLLLTANIHIDTMNVDIPKTDDSSVLSSPKEAVIALSILNDVDTPWGMDGQRFSDWNEFSTTFLAKVKREPRMPVVIAADKRANVENMLKLLALMQSNQINATNIVMEEQ
ncbi:biopolymer transporter ExbD [Vibrio sp. SM6]|uniref:Biopolymer transporter ExbD n=1 Tax=Vibrio agarilyticus TaxID=2726741 RepID=A0A7X8YHE1_9VIBR|nr:biopolymer transporter ExbD [Vibrio agarilyticus]NLS13376.1 biopolymer transporter ExbD [Vibrio agarilyticus]